MGMQKYCLSSEFHTEIIRETGTFISFSLCLIQLNLLLFYFNFVAVRRNVKHIAENKHDYSHGTIQEIVMSR